MYKRLNCFTSLPTFVTFCFFDDNHPNRCLMIPQYGFDLYFSDSNNEHPFIYLLVICMFALENCSGHLPILLLDYTHFLLLSCLSLLYILCTNSLSDIWFANIFSHLVGCLFILLFFSPCADFEFDTVPLVYFLFCCLYFCCQI